MSESGNASAMWSESGTDAGLDWVGSQVGEQRGSQVQEDGCLLYGPMAASRAQALAVAVAGATIIESRRSQSGEYWLYLPAGGEGVDRMITELASVGIQSFVFLGGELAGNVAVGNYSRRAEAVRTRERYLAMGYEVSLHEMTREIIDYWVGVPVRNQTENATAVAAVTGFAQEKPRKLENSCETVASVGQFP